MMTKPITRSLKDPILWTHALFLINVYLYLNKGYYVLSVMLMINVVASYFYHLSSEKDEVCGDLDRISCRLSLMVIIWNLIVHCTWLQVFLSLLWLVISLIVLELGERKDYTIFHSLWHFMVFGGNIIVWSYLPILYR